MDGGALIPNLAARDAEGAEVGAVPKRVELADDAVEVVGAEDVLPKRFVEGAPPPKRLVAGADAGAPKLNGAAVVAVAGGVAEAPNPNGEGFAAVVGGVGPVEAPKPNGEGFDAAAGAGGAPKPNGDGFDGAVDAAGADGAPKPNGDGLAAGVGADRAAAGAPNPKGEGLVLACVAVAARGGGAPKLKGEGAAVAGVGTEAAGFPRFLKKLGWLVAGAGAFSAEDEVEEAAARVGAGPKENPAGCAGGWADAELVVELVLAGGAAGGMEKKEGTAFTGAGNGAGAEAGIGAGVGLAVEGGGPKENEDEVALGSAAGWAFWKEKDGVDDEALETTGAAVTAGVNPRTPVAGTEDVEAAGAAVFAPPKKFGRGAAGAGADVSGLGKVAFGAVKNEEGPADAEA